MDLSEEFKIYLVALQLPNILDSFAYINENRGENSRDLFLGNNNFMVREDEKRL
jgi:hypothetical protein